MNIQDRITRIVKEEVDKILYDGHVRKPADYANPITIGMLRPLTEGLIKTYPPEKTLQYVRDYFGFDNNQVYITTQPYGNLKIMVYVPLTQASFEDLEHAFALCGYFLAAPKKEELRYDGHPVMLQYEPKVEEEDKSIRDSERVLYHITPAYNINKIMRIGLSPRSKNELFDYPDRIYLLRGSAGIDAVFELGQQLAATNHSPGNNGVYAVLEIDVSMIPKSAILFKDPNHPFGVYTTSNINRDAIADVHRVDYQYYNIKN